MNTSNIYSLPDGVKAHIHLIGSIHKDLANAITDLATHIEKASNGILSVCGGISSIAVFQLYHVTGTFAEAYRALTRLADSGSLVKEWEDRSDDGTTAQVCYTFTIEGAKSCVILHAPVGCNAAQAILDACAE